MPDFSTMAQMMQNTANPQPRGMPIMRGVAAPAPAGAPMPPPGMTSGPEMGEVPSQNPMSQILQQVIQMFQQQTGRAPTQEELQAIMGQITGGSAGGGQPLPPMPSTQGPMPGQPAIPPNTNAATMRR